MALHWAIFPITQSRVTFIFFIPAIVLATSVAGRWPGVLVAVVGLINSAAMKAPGSLMSPNSAEQVALIAAAVVSLMVILVGDYYRSISRRELSDLHELHELSATLAGVPKLPEQLKLILSTFARMHSATHGAISTYVARSGSIKVAASIGADAPGLAFAERMRVVVADSETDAITSGMRESLRSAGMRSIHSTPLISRDGEILGALAVYFPVPRRPSEREFRLADICARKAAVFIERARAEELVSQRDRRFQSVLESSGVPFIILSPARDESGQIVDFRFVFLNTAASAVMRVKSGEITGRKVTEVLPRAWDDRARFRMYVEALEHNEVRQIERQTEADANSNWYHVVASPLDGDLAVWFADITQRKLQERELLEADRRKDEFLATLAHELRNPLAPIRQAATIARSDAATDAQKRWSNLVIERQVQHMSLLLDDLLDVSRITHGTLQLRKEQTDLQSILSAAVETARPLLDERRHQLVIDVPEKFQVNADPLRLAQVLSNLLTNAAKYTHPQGEVRVTAAQRDGVLTMSVEDSGIGIAAEDLPKVFGMFAQVRSAQEHAAGGLGIGLALAKGIVDLHGGHIEAASGGVGKGSRFTVRLPNSVAAPAGVPAAESMRAVNGVSNKRILVADDNRDAAESLAIILRLEGHVVELAHDGHSALESFTALRPDVALLDIGMPKANGYEVARKIRATPAGAGVLLIAITGWAQDTDKAESRAAGFDHHLTKPIEAEALFGLLDSPKG
ncbi:MAG TPA: ATP-binding protein [Steroidobacteraceae bacterium]|nr:ATP-binding protein [Steroidobacteraceae bacterium]